MCTDAKLLCLLRNRQDDIGGNYNPFAVKALNRIQEAAANAICGKAGINFTNIAKN
jgi:hypothetical protein